MSASLLDWNGSALKRRTSKTVDDKIARLGPMAEGVTRLLLCGNGLEALPDRIGTLKRLALLDLFKNKLSTLPASVANLQCLTHLNLSENRPLVVLPECVTALRSLISLHATNCRLRELPAGLGQLKSLTELCVGGNVLKTLPSSISDLSKLEELNVADNIIEDFPPSMVLLVALKAVVTTGNAGLPKALQVNVRGMKKAQIVLDEIEKAFRGKPPLARTGTTSTMTRVGSASLPQAQPQKAFWTVKSAYAASSAQELTVAAAEQIEVVTQDPSGWWMCRRVNGQSGWLPASFLTPPAAPGSEVEERIRVGMESMLRKHQSDLVGIIKAHGPASGSIPISDQMEARMRVLENQTKDWHTELEERLVAKLEKEKEATKEERERVLTKLRQLESEGDTSSAVVTSLHRELQRFEVMQAELVVLSRSAKQREEMRTQYGSESRVWDFYNTLCVRFEEWLLGIKSAASGVVSHDVQTTGGKVGGVMCLFGELCEIIPIVGEFGAVFKAAGSVIQAVDHERQQNVIMRISKFGTLAELQNLSANLAYNLTRRYEWQLLQLQSIPDMVAARREAPKWSVRKLLQRGKQKVEQVVLDKDPKSASEALADFVLSIFIYYLTASTRDVLDPVVLEQKLFECASRPIKYELNNKVNDGLEALIKKAGGFQLETTSGQKWTFNGVLTGAGVRTPHGVFFDNGAFMFPHIYQYCVGDADEVAVRQLVPCSVVDTSRQVASFVQPPQSALVQLRSLQQTMEPQGGELRRNASGSIAPPVDNIKQTANEMFDVFDVSRTGFLYPDEFVTAFEELGSLNATQFGAIVPDQTLREVCSVLSRGGPGVLREAFIDFYRKASLFTLRKACQTTLATRSGSQTIQQSVATAQVQGAPAVPLTQSVPSQYHGQVQGATMYPAQHPGQVQGATMYPTQHPGQAQAQMYPGQHPGQPSWGQPQVQGATMYPAQHPPGQSSWGQQQVQGAPMYPTQYPGQAQAHAATMYPAQYPPGQQSWGQPQVQGSPVTQSVASAQPGQAALASPAPPPRKLSFGLKK